MFRILQLWVCVVYNYNVCKAIHASLSILKCFSDTHSERFMVKRSKETEEPATPFLFL